MATGDQNDMLNRLQSWMPNGWVPSDQASAPIIHAVLWGAASVLAYFYSLFAYITLQTRILTAADGFLDMIAGDFFGASLLRGPNQSDASFRFAILVALFRERATRKGMSQVMAQITGPSPAIFEPLRALDSGGYGQNGGGYGAAGGYGSMLMPYQALVVAQQPLTMGIPAVNGYSNIFGGYGIASQAVYGNQRLMSPGADKLAAIQQAADAVRPVGTTVWVATTTGSPQR